MAPTISLGHSDDDELRKRGYSVGGILGEGSYAKVSVSCHCDVWKYFLAAELWTFGIVFLMLL